MVKTMTLDERKKSLLEAVIKEHIKTARPVASGLVVDKYTFHLSPATIRNEMMELEAEGYLTHRHTSSGRLPTEKGYRFFIDNSLAEKELSGTSKTVLKKASKGSVDSTSQSLKKLAKTLAHLSHEAVVVGFNQDDVYYTGITNIFHQPEFSEMELIFNIGDVIDHLDEALSFLYKEIDSRIQILLGHDNPFSEECAAILTKYVNKKKGEGVIGILGPMRMDYIQNFALIKYSVELISNL